MNEVVGKLSLLRAALAQGGAGAIRLRGADWFAWATDGVDGGTEPSCAELLVTPGEACILADEAEGARLRGAALPDGFTFHIAPWAEPELHDTYVLGAAGGGVVLTDCVRQAQGEQPLPSTLRLRRSVLGGAEQERYRELGRDAAAAVGEALRAARPDWTEYELAGACAHALWRRGMLPAVVLAAGERRIPLLREPQPTRTTLGRRALLRVSARRHGLHATLARGVAFDRLSDVERGAQAALLQLEATGLDAVRPGQSLAAIYHALDAGYRHANLPEGIRAGRQGGITGYALHELVATPSTATGIETGMALLLTPALGGAALADTFLLGPNGLESLTHDPSWPTATAQGRARPLWLEAA